jgi:hypothetical protein
MRIKSTTSRTSPLFTIENRPNKFFMRSPYTRI